MRSKEFKHDSGHDGLQVVKRKVHDCEMFTYKSHVEFHASSNYEDFVLDTAHHTFDENWGRVVPSWQIDLPEKDEERVY